MCPKGGRASAREKTILRGSLFCGILRDRASKRLPGSYVFTKKQKCDIMVVDMYDITYLIFFKGDLLCHFPGVGNTPRRKARS